MGFKNAKSGPVKRARRWVIYHYSNGDIIVGENWTTPLKQLEANEFVWSIESSASAAQHKTQMIFRDRMAGMNRNIDNLNAFFKKHGLK